MFLFSRKSGYNQYNYIIIIVYNYVMLNKYINKIIKYFIKWRFVLLYYINIIYQ
ncbi:hypothetical protein SAMN05216324_101507 [Chryseobacterium limigenitum]|uniref:Uncharacterized protein n=1 Tax=Chryseobacterium limigenitum TaxID=1612149 RepID=A0A1K2IEE2_9FLAO|nr:hypothetical protein SAMN05216324_101507 [Chryseobacterium limigenitum]